MASKLILEVLTKVEGTKNLEGLGSKLQRSGANLTKFVTLPLLGAAGASLALAADAEKSAAKLNAAYKNMGKTSGRSLDQLTDQATALGEATVFDDEGIMEAQAALLTFGAVSGDAFDQAIQGAADYAAATGTDVVAASKLFGKALADPAAGLGKLARAGIVFTDAQEEQIKSMQESGDLLGAQNIILEEVAARYGGVNAELQGTAAGQAAQAFEDLQNAGEDLGAIFLPILASLARGLSDVAHWFTDLPPGMQQFIAVIGTVIAAVGPLAFGIGKLVGAFKGVIAVFNLLKIALLTNPFTALAAAVVAIAALIILNWDKISAFLKKVWAAIMKALEGVADFFADAWQGIADAATGAWNAIGGIIRGAINGIIDVINGFFGFLNGIQIGIPSIDVGPVHVGGGTIDPFNIGLIPHLAQGGVVDSPTLALIGEGGPEAVVPLSQGGIGETHFHSHIDVRGEDPFIRNEGDLLRTQKRLAFLAGF